MKESQKLLESLQRSLNEEFNYNFTDEHEFGSLSNTDALETIEDLALYFYNYSRDISSNPEMYQGENQNVMSEVSELLYQAKKKLTDSWKNI